MENYHGTFEKHPCIRKLKQFFFYKFILNKKHSILNRDLKHLKKIRRVVIRTLILRKMFSKHVVTLTCFMKKWNPQTRISMIVNDYLTYYKYQFGLYQLKMIKVYTKNSHCNFQELLFVVTTASLILFGFSCYFHFHFANQLLRALKYTIRNLKFALCSKIFSLNRILLIN